MTSVRVEASPDGGVVMSFVPLAGRWSDHAVLRAGIGDLGVDSVLTFPSTRALIHTLIVSLQNDPIYRHVASDIGIMLALAEGIESQHEPAAVPLTERARELMQRVEIERAVRQSVLAEGTYSATEVGGLLGSTSKNPRDKASRLRQKGDLLGVEVDGSVHYPAFQFDASRAALRVGVAETNRALDAKGDSWAVASWWLAPHGRLDAAVRPADLALVGDAQSLAQLVTAAVAD